MRLICWLCFLLPSIAWAAVPDNPWKDLVGCYVTEQRNGAPVPETQDDFSQIREHADSFEIHDLKQQAIPSLFLMIYQKYSEADRQSIYNAYFAFDQLGSYTTDTEGRHFRFSGKLDFYLDPNESLIVTLIQALDVRAVDSERIWIHASRSVPEVPDGSWDSDDTYVLKRTKCLYSIQGEEK